MGIVKVLEIISHAFSFVAVITLVLYTITSITPLCVIAVLASIGATINAILSMIIDYIQ